jgi:outer membrane receptor protein involved in Fe transport
MPIPKVHGRLDRMLLLVALCALSCPVVAQVTTGTFLGTVHDNTSAAVAGASITVTNLQTGVARSVLSGVDGEYVINLLPVGNYSVRVEHTGFKTDERASIELQINGHVRLDFVLRVGSVSEKIEVKGSAPLLDTDTAESGEVIENQRVTQLPLNGRQFIQLALLTAGVVPEVKGTLSSPLALSGQSANANGARFEDNVFLLDGVLIRDEVYERLTVSPSIDAIEEFKVHTSNYSAEFGGHGGAQVNISTKSGTNALHGAVYEFLRNDVLDAKNYFDGAIKPPFRQNQFGVSLGGPIRRNNTFFFGNYEGSRIFKGITLGAALPTKDMRAGNFAGMGPIINPATQQPFMNDQIPDAMIAPFAKAMLANVPLPTTTGLGRNFTGFGNRDLSMDQFTTRIDHTFNNNNLVFGRFIYSNVSDLEPYPATVDLSSGSPLPPPGFGQLTTQRSRNLALQYTHVFSPNFLNQLRFGYNYLDAGQKSANSNVDFVSEFGFQGTNPPPLGAGFPSMVIPGFSTLGDATTKLFTTNNVFSLVDDMVRNVGKHSLKFGGGYTKSLVRTEFVFNTAGQYKFLGAFTRNPFADFLLGFPNVATALTGNPTLHGIGYRVGAYLQDDWRVTSRLTLNLGIRYDINSPFRERDGKMANFAPEIGGFVLPGTPGHTNPAADFARFPGVPFATSSQLGYPDALTNNDYNDFAPRIGFAYSATGSLVLRGGFGIFYNTGLLGGRFGIMGFNPPFTGLELFLNFDPTNPISAPKSLGNPATNVILGQGPTKNFRNAYLQEWNLSIEKQIGSSLMFESEYIGSRGIGLDGTTLPNQPAPGGTPRWPILGVDLEIAAPAFDSWYHGLILRGEKRYSHGLVLSASYTFSKSLDTGGGSLSNFSDEHSGAPQNSADIAAEKGRSAFDTRNRVVLNAVYELPIGAGKMLASNATGIVQKLVAGWQLNTILVAQSGRPETPLLTNDQSQTGAFSDRPNQIGNPDNGPKTPNEWFNVNAFQLQPLGQFGNAGRGVITGPGYASLDLGLAKFTPISERINLEFRTESFNLLNRPNFDLANRQFGTPTFGQIFSANDSRELQFALKFHF